MTAEPFCVCGEGRKAMSDSDLVGFGDAKHQAKSTVNPINSCNARIVTKRSFRDRALAQNVDMVT